jgi:FkbM family methyltransferase
MRDQAFNKTQWISNFRAKSDAWAVCSQDREAQDVIIPSDKRIPGELHCIEPAEETTTILQQVSTNMGLHAHGFRIHNAALSNYTGTTKFVQSSTFAGAEHLSIHSCYNPAYQHMCKDVPVYTLDDYVVQFVENQDAPIDYLSIDAEGSDFDVLRGGVETLKRARYLEFEVLSTGTWAHHGVMQAIYFLHQDFICYWAGKGRLFRITDCVNHILRSLYDRNYWANVACVNRREKDLIERMEKIFRETLDMPPKI